MSATLTIDLAAIVANWRALAARAPGAACAAVVKADAYGCGARRVGPALSAAGVRDFFVAHLSEGVTLREAVGPAPAIWVLNGLMPGEGASFAAHDLRPVLSGPAQVGWAIETGLDLTVAVQIDSGMNRLGLEEDEIAPAMAALADSRLVPALVMSHLACADMPGHPLTAEQQAVFARLTAGMGLPRSLSATAGSLLDGAYHFEMLRPGVGLFGGLPFAEARPVVRLDAPILTIRAVAAGEGVGYGATWTATRPSRVATIPVGYADGLIRAAGIGGAVAEHDGRLLPYAGRVSMDLITLDVTEAPELSPGDSVALLSPTLTVDRVAEAAGTIGYEILTSLGQRYARRWIG